MINLENKEEDNEEGTLGSSTRHAAVTGHSTMISDGQSPVSEVGDDESEGTSRDVEVGQDSDDLVMGHPVECLAEVNSGGNDSRGTFRGVVQVTEDKINHSNDVVNNGAARKSSKLVQANMWGGIFPDPLDEEFLHPFAEVRSQANAAKVIFCFRDRNIVDWDSKLFFKATWPWKYKTNINVRKSSLS